jgi:hypothetical protein
MSAIYRHVRSLGVGFVATEAGALTVSASIKPVLGLGMFRCLAASLGGCVQLQIANLERICDRVKLRWPLCVRIGGLKAADRTQPGEERSLRWI